MGKVAIHGFCDDAFLPLKEAFAANFEEGEEVGASLAGTWRGEPVVDLWAGFADREQRQPWREDTMVCVFSSTKVPTILSTLIAIDRGLLELDSPVARYWPEFGAHGKGEITVREAMTHRALVPGFATPAPYDLPYDWEAMVARIADEAPWFERGTLCYHPNTYGHLLGELVRRASGVSFRDFFEREVAEPLGADLHIGLRDPAQLARVAQITWDITHVFDPGSTPERVMGAIELPPSDKLFPLWENWEQLSSPYPGTGGVGNARAMARIGTVMAMGGVVDGRRYLSRQLVDEATREQCHAVCPVLGDLRLGLGFGLDGDLFPAPLPTSFHWGGYGGSWCAMDTESQTAFAYAMNRCVFHDVSMDARMERFWRVIGEVVPRLAARA